MRMTRNTRAAALLGTTAVALASSFIFASQTQAQELSIPDSVGSGMVSITAPTQSNISQTGSGAGSNTVDIRNLGTQSFYLNASPFAGTAADGVGAVVQDKTAGSNTLNITVQNTISDGDKANYLFVTQTGNDSIATLAVDGEGNTIVLTEVRTDNANGSRAAGAFAALSDLLVSIKGKDNVVTVDMVDRFAVDAADLIDIDIEGDLTIVEVTVDAFSQLVMDLKSNATVTAVQDNAGQTASATAFNKMTFLETTGSGGTFSLLQSGVRNMLHLTNNGGGNNITIKQINTTDAQNDLTMVINDSGVVLDLTIYGESGSDVNVQGTGNSVTLRSNVVATPPRVPTEPVTTVANIFGNDNTITAINFDNLTLNLGVIGKASDTTGNTLATEGNVNVTMGDAADNDITINNDNVEKTIALNFKIGVDGNAGGSNANIMTFNNYYNTLSGFTSDGVNPTGIRYDVTIDGSSNKSVGGINTADVNFFGLIVEGQSNEIGVNASNLNYFGLSMGGGGLGNGGGAANRVAVNADDGDYFSLHIIDQHSANVVRTSTTDVLTTFMLFDGSANTYDVSADGMENLDVRISGNSNIIGSSDTDSLSTLGTSGSIRNVQSVDLGISGTSNRLNLNTVAGTGPNHLYVDVIGSNNLLNMTGTMVDATQYGYVVDVRGNYNQVSYTLGAASVESTVWGDSFVGSVTKNAANDGYITSFQAGGTGYVNTTSGSSSVTLCRNSDCG